MTNRKLVRHGTRLSTEFRDRLNACCWVTHQTIGEVFVATIEPWLTETETKLKQGISVKETTQKCQPPEMVRVCGDVPDEFWQRLTRILPPTGLTLRDVMTRCVEPYLTRIEQARPQEIAHYRGKRGRKGTRKLAPTV